MPRIFAALALTTALTTPALAQQATDAVEPEVATPLAEPSPDAVSGADDFMVAAANPIAAKAGYDVLSNGGNAVDAMVAVQLMLNLVEPQSSGIGGGAFLLYFDAEDGLTTYDGREKAPMAVTPDYFLGENGEPKPFFEAVTGGGSVGVPGTLKLLYEVHAEHGTKPWGELLEPVIAQAEAGFAISPRLSASIAGSQERGLDAFDATRRYFFEADGTAKAAGTLLTNPEFAETLRAVQGGVDAFYTGDIAARIVAAVKTEINPGLMTMDDLAAYEIVEREPVCAEYRGLDICGMGPPSSGALTVGQILELLGHFDLETMGYGADFAHLFAEAGKLAYADRGLYMADSDFVRMPTEGLLDDTYMTLRAQMIDRNVAMEDVQAGNPPWDDAMLMSPDTQAERPGTSHFSIVDTEGNGISMTTTIETGFGSRVMVGGFLLNNELTDFSFRSVGEDGRPIANRIEPGKRPRSSMAPTVVMDDDEPLLLIGSPGGSRIIAYVAQAIVGVVDFGMTPQEALDMGHIVNRNGGTDLEAGTDAAGFEEALVAIGHEVNVRDLNSGLHAIMIEEDGSLTGGADPRREGVVLGD